MAKARCRTCEYFEWYFITGEKDHDFMKSRCGLHGGAVVDPDGEQPNMDHRGGCGYNPEHRVNVVQLELF
jgi:hypothetical protein